MKPITPYLGGAMLLGALATATFLKPAPSNAQAQNTQVQSARTRNVARAVQAPELVGGPWLNTRGGKPLTLSSRRGQVTVVEFWTFACSNCLANLPAYDRIDKRFKKRGVAVIGIHTPELEIERDPKNVARRVRELGIQYPVLIDGGGQNWNRWKQQYWPTIYLVDKAGRVRHRHIGELRGDEAQLMRHIETLLQEPAP